MLSMDAAPFTQYGSIRHSSLVIRHYFTICISSDMPFSYVLHPEFMP